MSGPADGHPPTSITLSTWSELAMGTSSACAAAWPAAHKAAASTIAPMRCRMHMRLLLPAAIIRVTRGMFNCAHARPFARMCQRARSQLGRSRWGGLKIVDGKIIVRGLELEIVHRGTGPLLLLLHGAGGVDPRAEFLDLLARHFELVAPSHPGFGNSPLPELFDSVDDLAYVYLDLLEEFDLREVILVGFSLGGWIAAEVAVRCAHRLSRLILVGPVGIKAGDRETRDIPDIFALAPDEVTRLVYHDPQKAAVDYAVMSDEQLRIIARNRQSLALYSWEPYMHNPKLRYRLGRLKLPTLLIRGASDGLISPQYLDAYRAAIAGARMEVIARAGHVPQIEQPRALVEQMLAFAREPVAAPG